MWLIAAEYLDAGASEDGVGDGDGPSAAVAAAKTAPPAPWLCANVRIGDRMTQTTMPLCG